MKTCFLILLSFIFVNPAVAKQLSNGTTIFSKNSMKLIFVEEGNKQFLVSKDKSNQDLRKVLVFQDDDGKLNEIGNTGTVGVANIVTLMGMEGDDAIFEIAIWNEANGDIIRLLGGENFNVSMDVSPKKRLTIDLREIDDAETAKVHLLPKTNDKTCLAALKNKKKKENPNHFVFDINDLAKMTVTCDRLYKL